MSVFASSREGAHREGLKIKESGDQSWSNMLNNMG